MKAGLSENITNAIFFNYERVCLKVFIGAYINVYSEKQYDLDWEEDQFTEWLIVEMKKQNLTTRHRLHIYSQSLIRKDGLPINENHPKISPKIDICFWNWEYNQSQMTYFIEAKNLSLNNWNKRTGTSVNATYYLKRYIETGIDNFKSGRYSNGCLAGYVLNGEIELVVEKLNEMLTESSKIENISKNYDINNYPHIYLSKYSACNQPDSLKHVFISMV